MESTHSTQVIKPVFRLLYLIYGIVPIVAGLDKFFNVLTQWDQYLHPGMASMLPFSAATFMMIVGIIEIAAGILVLIKPQVGGLIVAAWLSLIAVSLIAGGHYLDVAVRDLVMGAGAYCMARLGKIVSH